MKRNKMSVLPRRRFLGLLPAAAAAPRLFAAGDSKHEEERVSPTEDLMREHGLLKRVLLVYDELRRRIAHGEPFPLATVSDSAGIIRNFVEEYHEKLEEEHLFPRFRSQGRMVALVDTLQRQHGAGRRVTAEILTLARARLSGAAERRQVADAMYRFTRMYEPHEAREDTVLFPAFQEMLSPQEFAALGEAFERREHQLFGKEGFEGMVERVADIERTLGIHDLRQFTPQ